MTRLSEIREHIAKRRTGGWACAVLDCSDAEYCLTTIDALVEALRLCGALADNAAGHETSRLDGIKRNARAALRNAGVEP